jgi:hypothetical protein
MVADQHISLIRRGVWGWGDQGAKIGGFPWFRNIFGNNFATSGFATTGIQAHCLRAAKQARLGLKRACLPCSRGTRGQNHSRLRFVVPKLIDAPMTTKW